MQTSTLARTALVAPLPAIALEPLTATAYFRTPDGRTSGEPAWIDAWSGPLQDAAPGLFTWASAHTVYATYGKVLVLAFAGFLCGLLALRRTDDSTTGRFRWSWRLATVAYGLTALGVLVEYWTPWMDQAFLFLALPGMLLLWISAPFLGARMLRQRLGSRPAGWMIAFTMPAVIGITALTGHLGFAMVWLGVAWMLHARAVLARCPAAVVAAAAVPVSAG